MLTTQSIPRSAQKRPLVLIIRHAERFTIDTMINATQPTLTDKGKQDAYILGQELAFLCPCSIYFSPVKRCQETAEQINYGLQSADCTSFVIGQNIDLGGPYIKGDWKEIASLVDSIGQNEFTRRWFDGLYSSDMIMPLADAAELQLSLLMQQLKNEQRSVINITHDWNIMLLREYYLKIRHEDSGQPDFLDGLYIYKTDDGVSLNSGAIQKTIPFTENS